MIPKLICQVCGGEVGRLDRFCSSCGTRVEWQENEDHTLPNRTEDKKSTHAFTLGICPMCGNHNAEDSTSCNSCGAALMQASGSESQGNARNEKMVIVTPALNFFQSWKLTVTLGVLLIATVVTLKITRGEHPSSESLSPHVASMVKEIESLEKQVSSNPQDLEPILQLANLYHDAKMHSKAVVMYQRYLERNPSNPDVRTDLGISYFQLSFSDSTLASEYLMSAKTEIEKALKYAPKHQLAHFNLGIVTFHTGDIQQATEWFKKCVAIDSTSEVGRRALQFVSQHSFTN